MSFDNSRFTFNPFNDYSGVVMEQGRVQTDADWNEWLAELSRRIQAGTLDTMGRAVYPSTTPAAFQITASTSGSTNTVQIGCGRMYIDGLLVENHGPEKHAVWDPALAELSGSPQPPPATPETIDFGSQPYNPGATVPSGDGQYVAYLDVWRRPVTYIEDPSLVDSAIGVDTTGRMQTAWKVGLVPVASGSGWGCSTPVATLLNLPAITGSLSNNTVTSGTAGPCCLTTGTGYTGVENQFYRVEVHTPGAPGTASFKWSRENGSVQTAVTGIANGSNTLNKPAIVLTVQSLGRDQVLGFSAGDWIELTNETLDNACQSGELYKIDSVDVPSMSITLTTQFAPGSQFSTNSLTGNSYTRIIRWDQKGKLYTTANSSTPYWDLDALASNGWPQGCTGIPVPTDGSSVVMENGIVVSFDNSSVGSYYSTMDYWNFSARSATGLIDTLTTAPPRGIYHHYTTLSVVTFNGASTTATECRTQWPPAGEGAGCGCCTYTVGDNQNSFGAYTSINAAIAALPSYGGEVCILPGNYYENVVLNGVTDVVIHGCGWQTHVYSQSLQPSGAAAGATATSPAQSGFPAVFTVVASSHVELYSFCVHAADDEIGVLVDRSVDTTSAPPPGQSGFSQGVTTLMRGTGDKDVTIQKLVLSAATLPAIFVESVKDLEISENRVLMRETESRWAAVYLSGEDMLFKNNWVGFGDDSGYDFGTNFPGSRLIGAEPDQDVTEKFPFSRASLKATAQKIRQKIVTKKASGAASKEKTKDIAGQDITTDFDLRAPSELTGSGTTSSKLHNGAIGGIQIAGPSKNIFVVENEVVGGNRNGITLGNLIQLDANGNDTGRPFATLWEVEDQCSSGGTAQVPPATGTGTGETTVKIAAGGVIRNLHIDRNVIRGTGMSGIGPVGYFDLYSTPEVISMENLSITANVIARTMRRRMAAFDDTASAFGYGAISLPTVENLMIRDNIITDFGATPGEEVCGIFVLHGELVEISRNQIRETRDLSQSPRKSLDSFGGQRAGIMIHMATPPAMDGAGDSEAWDTSFKLLDDVYGSSNTGADEYRPDRPLYAPGQPALRIQENVVRVPIGLALHASGYGPFAVIGNHFGSGGTVPLNDSAIRAEDFAVPDPTETDTMGGALTVSILNMGLSLEKLGAADGYRATYAYGEKEGDDRNLSMDCGGAVLFTNNICQLEAWGSGVRGACSVAIFSLDHVLFSNNHLWLDGRFRTADFDAFLFGVTVQAGTNRLQEARNFPVLHSALTFGRYNITSHNISTYCLEIKGASKVDTSNLVMDSELCRRAKGVTMKVKTEAATQTAQKGTTPS